MMMTPRGLVGSVCVLALAACSGDDGHGRHGATTPTPRPSAPTDASTSTSADAVPVAAPGAVALDEDMAVGYFATGPAAPAAAAYAAGAWAEARVGFAAVAADRSQPQPQRDRAGLMAALAAAELSQWKAAASELALARAALPVLVDWITYQEARARYFAREFDAALTLARAVGTDSIAGADAALLVGDILRGRPDRAATAAHYRAYLTARPKGIRRSEARFRLAEALAGDAGAGVAGASAERLALLRDILIEDPLSSWATKAAPALTSLTVVPPGPVRLSAGEQITRGMVLFDAMRNPESEAAFRAALATAPTAVEACVAGYHLAQSRFKARDRKAAGPLFDDAAARCRAAGNADLEIKSAYQAGRAYAFVGDRKTAIARYQAAQRVDPAHSYTDDAVLREAEEYADLGDDEAVRTTLARIPREFPAGDMKAEALWRLGWRAWRAGSITEAIDWWKQQIATTPIDDNYWAEGQPQYWLGRAFAKAGQAKAALASWEEAVRLYPMQYYALLALNRIREAAPARFEVLMRELAAEPPGGPARLVFRPRPEWGAPGFVRGMELLRLGLGAEAEAELRAIGLTAPADKKRVDDPDLVDKLWAMAFLYDRAGRYATSHWPTRWHILDYRRRWPVGADRLRWQIAYPRAFWPLLTDHATRNQVPVAMQIAIVREESAFDPWRESYANAIGLTQMIQSTATRFAKGTGIDPTRDSLRDPEKNVTIGSRFLGFLFQHWKGFTMLVPPGYNAGEGGVARMLRVRGGWDADEFIEGIVDDQARNYSKRVLGSFFTYTWLYQQQVPVMPNLIPPELVARANRP